MNYPSPSLTSVATSCSQCSLNDLCLPLGINQQDMVKLEQVVDSAHVLQPNESLFAEHQAFKSLFAVKAGMIKTVSVDQQGNESVLGFHLPGELIGLDAIYPEHYTCSAFSIGTSSVCMLSYLQLTTLSALIPALQNQLLRLLSKELNQSQSIGVDKSAKQKVASFLLSLSQRYGQRGYSTTHLHLAMPRRDIANYLGMAPETISRLFKQLHNGGVVAIDGRTLKITDMPALQALANTVCTH